MFNNISSWKQLLKIKNKKNIKMLGIKGNGI